MTRMPIDWTQIIVMLLGGVSVVWIFLEKIVAPIFLKDWVASRETRRQLEIQSAQRKVEADERLTKTLDLLAGATNEVAAKLPMIIPTVEHTVREAANAAMAKHDITHLLLRDTNATLDRIADLQERNSKDISRVQAVLAPSRRPSQSTRSKKKTTITIPLPPPPTGEET